MKLLTLFCTSFLITLSTLAQYTATENKDAKACFKGFCDTDTLFLSSLKKTRSLPLITDNKELKVVEFTIMLTDVNNEVYVAVIKFDYLDRNNLDLLARSYKTLQLTDIFAKNKDGRLTRLKPKLYYIKP